MTHLKSVSVVLGIALVAVAQAPPQAAAATREATFAACQRDADTAVPMRTMQDQMNHYLRFTSCLEQHGITVGRPGRGLGLACGRSAVAGAGRAAARGGEDHHKQHQPDGGKAR